MSNYISVIIPTYHRIDLLSKTLECLCPDIQTLPSEQYEVIVTDDGSINTAEKMILTKFPWVRWVEGPKSGPAANRNNGSRWAKGEWLVFTDDDCLPEPGWLEAYASSFCSEYDVYEGRTTCRIGLKSPRLQSPVNEVGGRLWSCNFAIRKTLFDDIAGFDETFRTPAMEDIDLRERLRQRGHHFPFLPDALIDHPPRHAPWGSRRGFQHENEILFHIKHDRGSLRLSSYLLKITLFRLREIKHTPVSFDWIVALISLFAELITVSRRFYEWRSKYLKLYSNRIAPTV